MISDGSRSCSVFAFYGISLESVRNPLIYDQVIQWLALKGQSANTISYRTDDQETKSKSKRASFARGFAKLNEKCFDKCTSLEMLKIEAGDFQFDPVVSFSINPPRVSDLSVRNNVANLDEVVSFSLSLIDKLRPEYAIGYSRDRSAGPTLYAIGVSFGAIPKSLEEEEDSYRISRWSWYGMDHSLYRKGVIRDVYPYNLLNVSQLNREIGAMTLRKWISADVSRGRLTKLNEKLSLWTVEEKNIPLLQRELWDAGIIFDWHAYERELAAREKPKNAKA